MITTNFVPGSPCWIELGSPDLDASLAFYRKVFGWEAESAGPDTGGYVLLKLDGSSVGGAGPLMGESQRPAWTIYFTTEDADEAAEDVVRLGGTVLVEPMDVMSLGRMAQFTDPQGGEFAVWQAVDFPGMEVTDQDDTLCWTEEWTPDADGARSFYTDLFGWSYQGFRLPDDSGVYSIVTPRGAGEERTFGGLMQVDPANLPATEGKADWHPVFAVADCDAAAAEVTSAGGRVHMGPEDTPGVGRLAVCADPFQAGFVLLTPSPE